MWEGVAWGRGHEQVKVSRAVAMGPRSRGELRILKMVLHFQTNGRIEIRNKAVLRLNITIYLDKNNLFFDEVSCVLFIRDLTKK